MNFINGDILNPEDYDFINLITTLYGKLINKTSTTILWNQLLKKESLSSHEEELTEYRNHLPVELDKYLLILESKFVEVPKQNLQSLDGSYKTYFITFLFFCTRKNATVTDKAKLTACTLYLKLTMLSEIGKLFFNNTMYKHLMLTSSDIIRSCDVDNTQKETLIKLVKQHCLQEEHLDTELLVLSTNLIVVSMIHGATREMIINETATDLTACCMKALRVILLHTSNHILIKTVALRLFRCTRRKYLSILPNGTIAVDVIILFLRGTLQIKAFDRKVDTIIDAFAESWASPEFTNIKDAVRIMNAFQEEQYKDILRKIATFTEPKRSKTLLINVFQMMFEIFTAPPRFPFNKVNVLYTCIARNIMHHILNNDEEIVSVVINILKEISDDLSNPLHQYIFEEVHTNRKFVNMSIESVLLGLSAASRTTWSSVNKKLFRIFIRFVTVAPNLNPEIVSKVLEAILQDATPVTFEDQLETLRIGFLVNARRRDDDVAKILLNVIHKFAISNQYKISSTYAKLIFNAMLVSSFVNGEMYPAGCFYRLYLTTDFEFQVLFTRCRNSIGRNEVSQTIHNLDYKEPTSGLLLCCLLEYHIYTDFEALMTYINNNLSSLAGYTTVGYVCSAFKRILTNNETIPLVYHQHLNVMQKRLMDKLLEHVFPIQSINPVYRLYEKIREILGLPEDKQRLVELVSSAERRTVEQLHDRNGDDQAILYLNEICLVAQKIPSDVLIIKLRILLDSPQKLSEVKVYMPDVYVQILTLFCTVGMMCKSQVSIPLKYLHKNLYKEDEILKVITIKLLYSLCKEITHEYDEVVKFAFKEIVLGNTCLVRICVTILEELIHEDYVKLTSEEFYRVVYGVGCSELKSFVRSTLLTRFALSNQNDITRFFMPTVMYMNVYNKFPHYPIHPSFYNDVEKIKLKLDNPSELLEFLFVNLPINKKFNVLMEITTILEDLVKGKCKVDENFFNVLLYLITTVKMVNKPNLSGKEKDTDDSKHYYHNVMKMVEKRIIRQESNHRNQPYYMEFDTEIKKCTLALLKLLFYENELLATKIHLPLFDALVHWIDFIKEEIVHYIHVERGKDYDPYFAKLVQHYKKNKKQIDRFLSRPE